MIPSPCNERCNVLKSSNVPLDDFFKGTDLQQVYTLHLVVFDTGSRTLEFASTLCGSACNQVRFDPKQSFTFVDGGRTGSITFATGVGVDPVVGANYILTLRSGTDTMAVGGFVVPNVDLFLITNQTPAFDIDPFSGIQGMGAQASGLFAVLVEQGVLCLTFQQPFRNAELTLGGIDETKFQGDLIFASLPTPPSGVWQLPLPGVAVNGATTALLNTSRSIFLDSGSSNALFSTDTAELQSHALLAIYAPILPDIAPHPLELGAYGIACDRISSLVAVISLGFTGQDGHLFNLTIPSSELNVGPFADDPTVCQTLISALDGLELVGGRLLKHYYNIWDIGAQRMGALQKLFKVFVLSSKAIIYIYICMYTVSLVSMMVIVSTYHGSLVR
ncbi:acid protease [Guyanagaster necrorhizus]|uniref:Acid protease n=1 Tax=Guyanagaster necrorhizus TaxID=856835 RepID=A0A9P7VUF5_9AGAR|nr:acid protease [Guyanagaster necrorhizus MCA 3950]KAG7446309.1 acid protease [Guyanagaster necrorhizus MCA 3950]